MKKKILAISLSVILSVMLLFIIGTQFKKPIPLAEGLHWGMSPLQTTRLLGDAYEISRNTGDTPNTCYHYRAIILEQEAEITCFFWKNIMLTQIHIRWDGNTSEIFTQAYNSLYSYYQSDEDFYINTKDDHQISMGIDNGATGLFYTIKKEDTSVTIVCVDLH